MTKTKKESWWKKQATIRPGFEKVFDWSYSILLILVITNFICIGNSHAALWAGVALVWFLLMNENRKLARKARELTRECLDGWTNAERGFRAAVELNRRYEARLKKYEPEGETEKAK